MVFAILTKMYSIWPLFFHCLVQSAQWIIFMMDFTKSYKFVSKFIFSVFTFTQISFFHKIHHFGHVVFLYSGRKKCVVPSTTFRQGALWSPKCGLGPLNPPFQLFSLFLGPKVHFWGHFAPLHEKLNKQMVSGAFLATLGAKNRK